MKCLHCDNEAKPLYVDHCDFHQALGTFFQYESYELWAMSDGKEEFMEEFKKWMNSLTDEQKQGIYKHYWLEEK